MNSTWRGALFTTEMILDGLPSTRTIVSLWMDTSLTNSMSLLSCLVNVLSLTQHVFFPDTNDALHYYSHDNARTTNGVLNITTDQKDNVYKAFNEKPRNSMPIRNIYNPPCYRDGTSFASREGLLEFSAKFAGESLYRWSVACM
jgi:hypothetical protein